MLKNSNLEAINAAINYADFEDDIVLDAVRNLLKEFDSSLEVIEYTPSSVEMELVADLHLAISEVADEAEALDDKLMDDKEEDDDELEDDD